MPTGDIIKFFSNIIKGLPMIKHILLVTVSLWSAACAAHDGRYYSLHPMALQKALETCPQNKPRDVNCEQLKSIASRVNESANQLRINPQEYGQRILALQEKIAKQESALQKEPNQAELQSALAENRRELQDRLAIVKWLESPES